MLAITTNVSSLVAQESLSKTSSMLSTTLQRLSTGLKINSGADGPAALVISQEQQAQITGLNQAITNTSEATSMVQTTEGALSTINDLLNQIRSLALDSANSGVNDPNAQAANQAEVTNALQTIDRIATNTQFGTKKILDGSSGFTGVSNNANISFINAQSNLASAGGYAVNITTAAQRASVLAGNAQTGALAGNETLTINGVSIGLTTGQTQAQVINTINNYTGQTGVVAEDVKSSLSSASAYTLTVGGGPAVVGSKLTDLVGNTGTYAATDKLDITGTDGDGTAINSTITLANGANATVGDVINGLNSIYQHATASVDANGNIVLSAKANDPLATNSNFSLAIANDAGNTGAGSNTWAAQNVVGGDTTRLRSIQFGSNATVTVTSNVVASGTSSGFGTSVTTKAGVDIAGTIGGFAAQGNGNLLSGNNGSGAQGITISAGLNANDSISSVIGSQGALSINDNSLVFQIGANANQTVKVGVDNTGTAALGLHVTGNQFGNLGQINVQTQSGAQDTIKIIDAAIAQISTLRGTLGAIQSQTLTENANNLQTTLVNTTSAESVIRDTDFAAETANYSKYNVLMQVGTAVLQNSNQTAQLVTRLFQ
jgi:flagellin